MSAVKLEGPKWPALLKDLHKEVRCSKVQSSRQKARGELWLLLNTAICRYLRSHAAKLGSLGEQDLEDIAAEKSLDLLLKIESGEWDIQDRSPLEIAGFLSKVARNGLVDLYRQSGRLVVTGEDGRPEWDMDEQAQYGRPRVPDPPDVQIARQEFSQALRRCADQLDARSRRIWFFRAFYTMSSKKIAAHPDVRLKASHVDVLLQRSRVAIRDCMHGQGHEPQDMPPGTFVELWKTFVETATEGHGAAV